MEAVAKLNNLKSSPRKARLVIDTIRGEKVENALNILKYTRRIQAKSVEKLLLSAVSNWENKNEGERAEDSNLYVKEVFVGQGRVLKRWQAAPRGSAHRIRKPYSHITIIVDKKTA